MVPRYQGRRGNETPREGRNWYCEGHGIGFSPPIPAETLLKKMEKIHAGTAAWASRHTRETGDHAQAGRAERRCGLFIINNPPFGYHRTGQEPRQASRNRWTRPSSRQLPPMRTWLLPQLRKQKETIVSMERNSSGKHVEETPPT